MRLLRLRASATACTASSGPPFTEPAHRQSAGRSVVTATCPPLTSHVILSPGPTSRASQTSFGTVVCLLLVIVDLAMVDLLTEATMCKELCATRYFAGPTISGARLRPGS